MDTVLIAPCGMNCGICIAYLRDKNKCQGCRINPVIDKTSRSTCIIKNCTYLEETASGFCYDCEKYPCRRLKQLDKRYRTKYGMSMIDNLNLINISGLDSFVQAEVERWTCSNCDAMICVHRKDCLKCGETRKDIKVWVNKM